MWRICLHRDMMANIKRVAKKIQGGLPIVGLLSRLSAPGGGFDEIVSWLKLRLGITPASMFRNAVPALDLHAVQPRDFQT
jgi:hypothetical protein